MRVYVYDVEVANREDFPCSANYNSEAEYRDAVRKYLSDNLQYEEVEVYSLGTFEAKFNYDEIDDSKYIFIDEED